jgi:hypothetical protein
MFEYGLSLRCGRVEVGFLMRSERVHNAFGINSELNDTMVEIFTLARGITCQYDHQPPHNFRLNRNIITTAFNTRGLVI